MQLLCELKVVSSALSDVIYYILDESNEVFLFSKNKRGREKTEWIVQNKRLQILIYIYSFLE